MFLNKKKPKLYDVYSPCIKGFGNIYCPNVTYEEDKIDLSKVPDLYCKYMVYDGYDFYGGDLLDLYFSFCLLDINDLLWGVVSVSKSFTVNYNEIPEGSLDIKKNLTVGRLIISQMFPFKMVSMFYKEDNGYYFYAKSVNGTDLYICIHIEFKDYMLMQTVINNLYNRKFIESNEYMIYNLISKYKKLDRISFIVDFKVTAYSIFDNNRTMIILMSVNNIDCSYVVNINIGGKLIANLFAKKCTKSKYYVNIDELSKVINNRMIFRLDDLIKSSYFKDINKSTIEDIQTTYYAIENMATYCEDMISKSKSEEDFDLDSLMYIQIDEPASRKLYDYIVDFIYKETYIKVSIE